MTRRTASDLDAVDSRALDAGALDEVRSNLGQQRTDELLGLLAEELSERFGPASDADTLAYEAHVMISAAGALGFVGLSDLCRAVEAACRAGDDPTALRERLVQARDAALRQIEVLRAQG